MNSDLNGMVNKTNINETGYLFTKRVLVENGNSQKILKNDKSAGNRVNS